MKIILFVLSFVVSVTSYAQKTIINDPNAELRSVPSFHAIEISDGIDLLLSQGDEEAMAVSATTNPARDAINTMVDNGVLKIWNKDDGRQWVSGNKKMRAYVSFKTLNRLKASGGCDVVISAGILVDKLTVELSGASDLKGKIEAVILHIEQSGASDADISGKVTELVIHASGASDVDAYGLKADNCTVNASGASDVKITVIKQLTANASGASSIRYHGKPEVYNAKTAGGGKIIQ